MTKIEVLTRHSETIHSTSHELHKVIDKGDINTDITIFNNHGQQGERFGAQLREQEIKK